MGTSSWYVATIETAGVMMLDRKLANDCGAAEARALSESMITTAPYNS